MASLLLMLAVPAAAKDRPPHMPPPVPPATPENCTAAEHRQFDFWLGEWDVVETAEPAALRGRSTVESINFGCGIRENWSPFTLINGSSLSLYDRSDQAWHQTYIDAYGGRAEYRGGLKDGRMVLIGPWHGLFGPGKDATVRLTWARAEDGDVRQLGETSVDGGNSWKPWFDFTYQPRRP